MFDPLIALVRSLALGGVASSSCWLTVLGINPEPAPNQLTLVDVKKNGCWKDPAIESILKTVDR